MSLVGFQRALADLAGSRDRCVDAIADPIPFLASYDLTGRERSRLASMARDRLMATNCVLYRANRMTPIYIFLPMTCQVLGTDLRREMEEFWNLYDSVDLQYLSEIVRFVRFLRGRLQAGEIRGGHVAEILEYESALTELRFAPRGVSVSLVVRFTHDPVRLLDALAKREPIPHDLESGEYRVMLDGSGDSVEMRVGRVA